MRYSSTIDNMSCKRWGLSLQQGYVFSFLYSIPSWAEEVILKGKIWYFASRNKAIEEVPLATEKADTMYRYYKQIEEKGLIEYKKIDGKDCIRLTEKGKQWNQKIEDQSEYSEMNPSKLGNESENSSEMNPTYKYTNINKDTIDDEEASSSILPAVEENRKKAKAYADELKQRIKFSIDQKDKAVLIRNIIKDNIGILENYAAWMQNTNKDALLDWFIQEKAIARSMDEGWRNAQDLCTHLINSIKYYRPGQYSAPSQTINLHKYSYSKNGIKHRHSDDKIFEMHKRLWGGEQNMDNLKIRTA